VNAKAQVDKTTTKYPSRIVDLRPIRSDTRGTKVAKINDEISKAIIISEIYAVFI